MKAHRNDLHQPQRRARTRMQRLGADAARPARLLRRRGHGAGGARGGFPPCRRRRRNRRTTGRAYRIYPCGSIPLLYLTGDHLAFDMAGRARRTRLDGLATDRVSQRPPDPLRRRYNCVCRTTLTLDAMIIMSPRVAAHFTALAREGSGKPSKRPTAFFCLSSAVADSLAPLGAREIKLRGNPRKRLCLTCWGHQVLLARGRFHCAT